MSSPFQAAWMLLKNVRGGPTGRRMPMTEEESYGDVSFREHPLHGLEDDDEDMGGPSMPPMSRTMGGTPPANIGRAGSTDEMPMGEPPNPFPKPLEGRVQDQLAEFADGAGRRAAMESQTDYSNAEEEEDYGEAMDAKLAPFVGEAPKDGISDPHPEAHNIASTNLRQTPRKQKRSMMDSGQAFKRPGFRGPAMPLPGGKSD